MVTETTSLSTDGVAEKKWFRWTWALLGPGIFVCLADTDAGCLITAGQSGAKWGYSLLLLQIVLIPILFAAQELTIRLAVYTQQGHTACIREHFGPYWSWAACVCLLIECTGAMISEMSGVDAVAQLWGADPLAGPLISAGIITSVVLFCSYKQIEIIGIALGLFELTFVLSMFLVKPPLDKVFKGLLTFHTDHEYLMLFASNIGAVIMPWMIYFQQSAVVARGIAAGEELQEERAQTLVGSVLTQLVMIGTLVTMAATSEARADLEGANDFVEALEPTLGNTTAKVFVSLAFVGGSLCAAFIVAITPAWAVCEAMGRNESFSLDRPPSQAPLFYGSFLAVVCLGTAVLLHGVDLVQLNIYIELMDALLLPMALGFLYILAVKALPDDVRLKGGYQALLGVVFTVVILIGVSCGLYGLTREVFAI